MISGSQIECAAFGRVYFTPVEELPLDMTPPRPRALRRHSAYTSDFPTLQQTHAEVWVATCEGSVAYIEIIDALAKVTRWLEVIEVVACCPVGINVCGCTL